MGAYNFKPQFEDDIMADRKRHTIRAKRKHPDKPGSICHLFVGMRTKKCRLLKRRKCVKVQDITIKLRRYAFMGAYCRIRIDGVLLRADEYEALARSDGFPNFKAMFEFWDGRLPFHGDLIHWESDAEWRKRETARVMDRWQPTPNPPRKNSAYQRRKKTLEKRRRKIARELR